VRNAAQAFRETGCPADGHDELLSRPCLSAQPYAPVVRSPRQEKRSSFTNDTTDVGVDAVLSADVGDAPMRRRQYTAPVEGTFCADAAGGARKH
jgi:hypothetical protein